MGAEAEKPPAKWRKCKQQKKGMYRVDAVAGELNPKNQCFGLTYFHQASLLGLCGILEGRCECEYMKGSVAKISVLNRQPAVTSVWSRTSVIIPTALWLSLRYTSALETLHLNSDPPSPADGLISYPVGRRTTKLTQLMPYDRSSVRDRRGDCQRLLPPARRDARNAVLREPDSALLPGPSPPGVSQRR